MVIWFFFGGGDLFEREMCDGVGKVGRFGFMLCFVFGGIFWVQY